MNKQSENERILDLLLDYRWHSTRELIQVTGINRISARVYDIQKGSTVRKPYVLESRRVKIDGIWWKEYRLLGEGTKAPHQLTLVS